VLRFQHSHSGSADSLGRKPKGHDFIIDRRHRRPAIARHMSATGGSSTDRGRRWPIERGLDSEACGRSSSTRQSLEPQPSTALYGARSPFKRCEIHNARNTIERLARPLCCPRQKTEHLVASCVDASADAL
jgi:hypothetical protein